MFLKVLCTVQVPFTSKEFFCFVVFSEFEIVGAKWKTKKRG